MLKSHAALLLCGVLFSIALLPSASEAALAGIDFGSQWMKIAVLKPGMPFAVATNEQSKRKTPNYIGFQRGERLLGDNALQLSAKVPKTIFSNLRSVLGKGVNSQEIADLKASHFAHFEYDEAAEHGGVVFRIDSETKYTSEELVAMLLDYARDIASKFAQVPIKDVVITVPPYFGPGEKQALLDAARIAGLNVMSLVVDTTAVAIQHGVYRPAEAADENMIIYDLGSGSLGVTLVTLENKINKYNKTVGHLTVRAHAWDANLGGNSFDQRIALHLAEAFNKKHNTDVYSSPRAMMKLLSEARKMKEILSANQAAPVFVEGLYDDRDLQMTVTREEFEKICADLFDRALLPVQQVLAEAGMDASNISVIELFGGSTRIPKVQASLESLGIPVGRHLNSDEAAVLGATFVAGSLSSSFRVKDYNYKDGILNGFGVSYPGTEGVEERNLFPKGSTAVAKKVLAFPLSKDFSLTIFTNISDTERPVFAEVDVSGVDAVTQKYPEASIKVNVGFQLQYGVLNVTKAEAVVEEMIEVEEPVPTEKPEKAQKGQKEEKASEAKEAKDNKESEESEAESNQAEQGDDSKAESTETKLAPEDDKASEEAKEESEAPSQAADSTTIPTAAPEAPKTIKKLKKRTHRPTLSFKVKFTGNTPLSKDQIETSRKVLADLEQKDAERARDAEARDNLERFIYSTKEKLYEEENHPYITEEDRSTLSEKFDEAESWLYDDGATANAATSRKKLNELKDLTRAWFLRLSEVTDRPKAIAEARLTINSTRELLKLNIELGRNITKEEEENFLQDILEFETWLNETIAKQDGLQSHEAVVLQSSHINYRRQDLEKKAAVIMRKPMKTKPKPKPTTKPKAKDEGTAESGDKKAEQESGEAKTATDEAEADKSQADQTQEQQPAEDPQSEKKDETQSPSADSHDEL